MNATREEKQVLISRIDNLMERMKNLRKNLVDSLDKKESTPNGTWVIKQSVNMYYQHIDTNRVNGEVTLLRHGKTSFVSKYDFEMEFTLATPSDILRHELYLVSKNIPYRQVVDDTLFERMFDSVYHPYKKNDINLHEMAKRYGNGIPNKPSAFDTTKCDFYMLTIEGENGSKKRHETFESAEKEAIRLCQLTEKEVFMVGVVASVKPIKTTKTITTIIPQTNRR